MKIKFGAIVTDGRGKIGGHVASKNRSGAYMRTKVTPANPNTTAQSNARNLLTTFSQKWRTLTDAQRKAWSGAVSDYAKTDIFGDIKNPTGLNLFIKVNTNLANVDLPQVLVPQPLIQSPAGSLDSAVFSLATGVLSISYVDTSAVTPRVLIRATKQLSPGISFVKTEYRVIGYADIDTGQVLFTSQYQTKFGLPVIGSSIFLTSQFVLSSGVKTLPQEIKISVVA